jgi:predicted phosphoribosyltransferase
VNGGLPFRDRFEAGRVLARLLERRYRGRRDLLVLALPRGGVPVASEVARVLRAPLDVFLVRKLGVPGHAELAMGAIATGDTRVLNEVASLLRVPGDVIEEVTAVERRELERRTRAFRGNRPDPDVAGRTVLLVDDGLATGSTMEAAIAALRRQGPRAVVVAVPVGSAKTCARLSEEVDDLVCVETPEPFYAVGQAYEDFTQVEDDEVRALLADAQERSSRTEAVR